MIKPTEKFNFSEPLFNTVKLGLIRLSDYNSVFNVKRNNNQFLYASTVIDDSPIREPASPISERLSSNTNSNINTNTKANTNSNSSSNPNTNTNTNTNKERAKPPAMAEPLISRISSDSNIKSVPIYNYKGIPLLYSTIIPGAYEKKVMVILL